MTALALALIPAALLAQIPDQDSRNTNTPGSETHMALPSFHSRAEWEQRKAKLSRQILFAAGLYPMPERTPLHPQIFGRIQNRDCTIEKVLLETMPGFYLGGNLFRPLHPAAKNPAVLVAHGHWQYGRLENQPLYSGPSLGINLARQGYVVFAWDMVGYNDTIQTPHAFGNPTEQLWSFGPLGLQLWNSIRALDFVTSLDDVDPARVGMTGASGGATQTLMLAAVDNRLQFAAPVNMVSAIYQGGDFCENAPGLRLGTNNVEVAAMFAPKPLMLVSATGDWTRNTPNEEFPAIRRIYDLYDKPGNVETTHLDAPHNYNKQNREAVYRFFAKHVLGDTDEKKYAERNVQVEMLQNMLALSGRPLPANALSYDQLFEQWKAMSRAQGVKNARERLTLALGAEWPEKVVSSKNGESIVLSRPSVGDRIPGTWIEGKGKPLVAVGADIEKMRREGRPVLLIDVFQTGKAVAPRDRSARHFLTFNQSDDACRVQDILTALAFVHNKYPGDIELAGFGSAAVWAEFASALAPVSIGIRRETGSSLEGRDENFLQQFNVPGIQRAGGIEALRAVRSVR